MKAPMSARAFPNILIVLIIVSFLIPASLVLSHGDHKEPAKGGESRDTLSNSTKPLDSLYAIINENYQSVRHIFKHSCFDCHSKFTEYPWYYETPGIKGMIDDDIKTARGHFDLSDDFPFISEHSQLDLLKDIKEEIENDDMPLLSYRMLHWGRLIEGSQRDSVFEWIDSSISLLNQNK